MKVNLLDALGRFAARSETHTQGVKVEGFTSLADQLRQRATEIGITKNRVAAKLGVSASAFSASLRAGMPLERMEAIAAIVGVRPGYFDEYAVGRFVQCVKSNPVLLDIVRLRACALDDASATEFDRTALSLLYELMKSQKYP